MSKEVLTKKTVLGIIKEQYDYHKDEGNTFTASALAALHNMLKAIEGYEMTDCSDCPYFHSRKGVADEQTG